MGRVIGWGGVVAVVMCGVSFSCASCLFVGFLCARSLLFFVLALCWCFVCSLFFVIVIDFVDVFNYFSLLSIVVLCH